MAGYKKLAQIIERLRALDSESRAVNGERERLRGILRSELEARGVSSLAVGSSTVRLASYTRQVFDVKAFAAEHPRQYGQYTKEQTVSRIEVVG